MSFITGKKYKLSIFGTSHGKAIGVTIDTPPPGFKIDFDKVDYYMSKRAPASNPLATSRTEKDKYEIISGVYNGFTNGSPLTAIIENTDQNPRDYENSAFIPRPSHADYTSHIKYGGFHDKTGGGHFSGRLTAPLCIAGAIALQILENFDIKIYSHIKSLYDILDYDMENMELFELEKIEEKSLPYFKEKNIDKTSALIEKLRKEQDSAGGVIESGIYNIPAGYGSPMFDTVEGRLSNMMFSIPAIKGVEFGSGFLSSKMKGSEHNDDFFIEDGKIISKTNNSGGINGGITNSMPIIFRCAVKPTPSIGKIQKSVDLEKKENTNLEITGRHDPAIVLRAVPVVKAAAAIAILDLLMDEGMKF